MQKLSEYLFARQLNAGLVAFACAISTALGLSGGLLFALPGIIASGVVVALLTLQRGAKAGAFTLTWVALPAICLLVLHRAFGIYDVLLVLSILAWIFAACLRAYHSWRLVLEVGAVLGLIAVFLTHLIIPDVHQLWAKTLLSDMQHSVLFTKLNLSQAELTKLAKEAAQYATGNLVLMALLLSNVQLFLARWWQTALYKPGALRKEFLQTHMGKMAALVLVVVVLGVVAKFDIFVDCMPVIIFPFAVAGITLVHCLVARRRQYLLLLVAMYFFLLLAASLMLLVLSAIGFIDVWYDFRHKLLSNRGVK